MTTTVEVEATSREESNSALPVGASVVMSGLTAWQGLFDHGQLRAGLSVLVHGAAGSVGSMVAQLARGAGAHVIGTGRAAHRQTAMDVARRTSQSAL